MREVVDHLESRRWDLNFYMSCIENPGRNGDQAWLVAGRLVSGEYFRDDEPARDADACKTDVEGLPHLHAYAATRQCATAEARKPAVDLVFDAAKPGDAVIVGMFPQRCEQVAENCPLVDEPIARRSSV